ncbi:chorismate-binding protein, partial [Brevirhabdus sp.]|uniref:chorismate-binding protein n=1 Tax=Brevirhabdus sp. TaxID=2004514 RepID=UPI00405A154F
KLRAMEIIDGVEGWRRGPYCGAIGQMDAEEACFNVAIRTLRLTPDGRATFGVGSGVVADSEGEDEWRECLSKARFLSRIISSD